MGIIDLLKDIPLSAVLKEKIVALETENEALRAKNESLKVQLGDSEEKRRALDEKIVEKQRERLNKVTEAVLLVVCAHDELSDQEISELVQVTKPQATFHLHELKGANLIAPIPRLDENARMIDVWRISQEGRRYLNSHGLL